MKGHHNKKTEKNKFKNGSLLFFGVASLLWFLFRTGTKPSRIVYPCQRAALANSSMLLSAFVPLSIAAVLTKTKKFLSKKAATFVLLTIVISAIISSEQFWGSLQPVGAANQEIQLTLEPRNATTIPASDIYVVNGHGVSAPISELIDLMGSQDLLFYKSNTNGINQGPDGLIANDDVVLIKINEQWPCRGGTNTDVLKEIIQAIVDHHDGFVGEIVVADNGQGEGSMDWSYGNAENISQSTQDVVDMFSPYYNVSTYTWSKIRDTQVDEYSEGDMTDGYILYDTFDPETGIKVSYPKFRTEYGTYISFKNGIWNGTGYEERLKVINVPVLKSHYVYGVTASVKNYMGVQSEMGFGGLANGHNTVRLGGMGTLMVETGLPTLNIVDAIWINARPKTGPSTHYSLATRVNVLMASTDPVALDYWAAKHVLVQAASFLGFNDTRTLDPDNSDRCGLTEAFGVWLNLSKNEIITGNYDVTTNENHMNVYVRLVTETEPPMITILSPLNITYTTTYPPLTFTVNEPTSWIGYSLNNQANVTITGNTTLTDLSPGTYNIIVYANDTYGNMGVSETIYFTIVADAIDVYTQNKPFDGKGLNAPSDAFAPQEEVTLYAYVSHYDDPVENKLVAFQVNAPSGESYLYRTNTTDKSGVATISFRIPTTPMFGEWSVSTTVDIAERTVNDTLTFKVGWIIEITQVKTIDIHGNANTTFTKGEHVYFNFTVQNIAFTSKKATLTLVVYDECGEPIGIVVFQDCVIGPGGTEIFFTGLQIPRWAYVGVATVYANAYAGMPQNGGTPYCPEAYATFVIRT